MNLGMNLGMKLQMKRLDGSWVSVTRWGSQCSMPQIHRKEHLMPDSSANDDIKAKMREALDHKNRREKGVHKDGPLQEKAHGSEVAAGGPKVHRRKAGGGGS